MAKYLLSNLQKYSSNMESSDINTDNIHGVLLEQQNCEILENGNEGDKPAIYFGVHIPSETQQIQDAQVYMDRIEAMKVVRKYKKARFKVFNYFREAMEFAKHGSEHSNATPDKSNGHCYSYGSFAPVVIKENTQTVGEKPTAFRGPKSQDLVKFRKAIESGNLELVRTTVWDNPRYLISSGDTPSILQEGSRYNALHVAAKAKNRKMCEIILSTISNNQFIRLLYGEDNNQDTNARANMLIDLYLNTPDKGTHESPLHFAVKLGAADVVELLVSFPQCDKTLKNKFGYSLNMLVCDRCDPKNTPNLESTKRRIEMLLKDTYYVPVLRSQDNCIAPIIGEPFAPNSPPNINTNLLFPKLEIKAYAGPMDKKGADNFRRVWKTPPRSLVVNSPSKHVSFNRSLVDVSPVAVKMRDANKGVERVGRALASKFNVDWKEEWKFLDWFGDLSTDEGLERLEKYLADRECSETNMSSSGSSLLEGDILEISRSKSNDNCLSPISDLCKSFAAFNLSDSTTFIKINQQPLVQFKKSSRTDLLNGMEMLKSDLHPLFYLEKSCQVFAHRFTNAILNLDSDYDNPTVSLENQLKPLQQVISSFMNDARFVQVDFRLVHSRLGTLIGNKLKEYLIQENDHIFMKNTLEKWLETCSKRLDCFSSDDESCNHKQTTILRKNSTSKNKQILCLLENVLSDFTFNDRANVTVKNEEECVSAWDKAKPCACIWRAESSRKSSLSKKSSRYLFKSSSSKDDIVARQLNFGTSNAVSNSSPLCDNITFKLEINQSIVDKNDTDSEDVFYTPPSSPLVCEDELLTENEVFEDSIYPEFTIFLEGDQPSKTDFDVFNSVNLAEDRLDYKKYPNIYKWHHAVSLFSEEERSSWSPVNYVWPQSGASFITCKEERRN